MNTAFVITALFFPAGVLWLTARYRVLDAIGAVLLCYAGGIVLGNAGVLPGAVLPLQSALTEATVALSLPLLLFSMDVRQWFAIAGKAIVSMLLAVAAVLAVSTLAFFALRHRGDAGAYQLAGMAVGVYTGGTPNLAAIKTALSVDNSTYILFHTYDAALSLLYLLLILSVGQRLFNRFLPPFRHPAGEPRETVSCDAESANAYRGIFSAKILLPLAGALLLAGAVIAASLQISAWFPADRAAAVTILSITTLSILLSFVPRVRHIEKSFQVGMYIIYIFCFVVASMTDLKRLEHLDGTILFFVSVSIFGSMALHALLSKLFRIDTDTFLVTSVSAICSPPFVPMVAGVLKNPSVLLSGITTGIIGYALGNYLGISLALVLQQVGGSP